MGLPDDKVLEEMIESLNRTTARASAAIDDALAFVEKSNRRIARMEQEGRLMGTRRKLILIREMAANGESTLTAKGQTTVPLKIREHFGAAPGTRLVWHVMPDVGLLVRVKKTRAIR